MTEHLQPEQIQHEKEKGWEERVIGEETFLVKKDLVAPTTHDGQSVLFAYDEYHHPETGMEIKVWKLGMDKPKDQPAIVRLDYGCPCMEIGTNFHLVGHDCSQQRQLMFDTIADLGIGAIATVSEQAAAGNGHGAFAVIEESTERYLAMQDKQPVLSMEESYLKRGYFPFDARRHDVAAKALADSVGDRPVIPAMSSQTKIHHLQDAGMNLVEGMRVELVSSRSEEVRSILRRSAYHNGFVSQQDPGAYLIQGTSPIRLTRESYQSQFAPSRPRPQRLVN